MNDREEMDTLQSSLTSLIRRPSASRPSLLAWDATGSDWKPPGVDEVPHRAPLVGEGLGEVRPRPVQLAAAAAHAVDHLAESTKSGFPGQDRSWDQSWDQS